MEEENEEVSRKNKEKGKNKTALSRLGQREQGNNEVNRKKIGNQNISEEWEMKKEIRIRRTGRGGSERKKKLKEKSGMNKWRGI